MLIQKKKNENSNNLYLLALLNFNKKILIF